MNFNIKILLFNIFLFLGNNLISANIQIVDSTSKPNSLTIDLVTKTDILTCYGAAEGTITISASGGFLPYQYSVDGGTVYQASNSFTNLVAGGYTIIVKDNLGAVTSDFAFINDRPQIFINNISKTDVTGCYGDANGTITITASGGTSVFEYSDDGGTNYFNNGGNFINLPSNSYNIYVRDSNGCEKAGSSISINQPLELEIANEGYTNIQGCYGANNGVIDITAAGGTSTISYSINGGTNYFPGHYFSALLPGTYNIAIKDINNCITIGSSITLTEPPQVIIDSEVSTDVNTCYGDNTGTITITASGGTGQLQYSIDGGNYFQTVNVFNGLYLGTYNVVVRDQNLCSVIGSTLSIAQPPLLKIDSETKTDVLTCFGDATGQIIITASGGTPAIEYSIDDGVTYQASNIFNGLVYGSYSVRVKDSENCEKIGSSHFINQPVKLQIFKVDKTNVNTCFGGNNGTVSISANGGTPALEYSADNGATFSFLNTITGLSEGFYTIVVKDSHSCSETFPTQIYISQPTQITISDETFSEPLCNGGTDGQVSIMASGGTGTLQYSANSGTNYFLLNVLTELSAGINYSVRVKDANGCVISGSDFILSEPPALVIDAVNYLPVSSCHGGTNGEIEIIVSGGTPQIYYSIDGGANYSTNNNYTGLNAGTYWIMVKDAHDCVISGGNVTLTQPAELYISNEIKTDIHDCKGAATGTITINSTGGTEPLEYSVDGGLTYFPNSGYFTGLVAGTYTLAVRDDNGCIDFGSTYVITEPQELIPTTSFVVNSTCFNSNDGKITLAATGGQTPYSFSVNGGATFVYSTYFAGLTPGSYQTYVKDNYGCVKIGDLITITQPDELIIQDVTYNSITDCYGDKDGSISITSIGGTPTVRYSIDNGSSYFTNTNFTSLDEGTYYVRVVDNNTCVAVWNTPIEITQPAQLKITTLAKTDITCFGLTDGTISFTGTGGTGVISFSIDNALTFPNTTGLFSGLAAGIYKLKLKDENNCVAGDNTISIYEPTQLVITGIEANDESCINFGDGSIEIFAAGGTPDYQYSVDGINYQVYLIVSGLIPGTYTPYLKDSRNCVVTSSPIVIGSPQSTSDFTVDVDEGCSPLDVQFERLAGGVTYLWKFGDGTTSTTNVPNHTYTNFTLNPVDYIVTAYSRSSTGCIDTANMTIRIYPQPALSFDVIPDSTYFPDATANFTNTSIAGYTNYYWDFGDGNFSTAEFPGTHTYDTCGVYKINLSADNNWCSDTVFNYFKIQAHQPVAIFDVDNINGCTPVTLNITDESLYANSFLWTFDDGSTSTDQNPSHFYEIPGVYNINLKVFGYCGTSDIADTIVHVWASPLVEFNVSPDTVMAQKQPIHCYNYSENNSTYFWTFGDGESSTLEEPVHFYQQSGDYPITLYVTSENLCIDSLTRSTTVHVIPYGRLLFPNAFSPNGNGKNDVFGPTVYESVKKYELKIFNRGSELVFFTTDINQTWDGTFQGSPVAQDVYVWKVSGMYENDEPFVQAGSVTLVK